MTEAWSADRPAFVIATAILGFGTIASLLFTVRALAGRSWVLMWLAALASLAVSFVTIFSIGALVFLLTCVQLAATVAMRRGASRREWIIALFLGIAVWIIVIPGQFVGPTWLPGFGILVLFGLFGLILPLLPISVVRSRAS
jgi:hypothetical protein